MNISYRMLITDFDGTLVDTDFKLSPKVKTAVAKLISKGCVFSIATGRCYQGIVKKVCQDLSLTAPQITSGGAEIVNPKTNQLLWHQYIAPITAQQIIAYFLDNNYQFAIESQGSVFTPAGVTAKGYGSGILFKDIKEIDYNFIPKISLYDKAVKNLAKEAEKLSDLYPDLHIVRSGMKGSPVLDITSQKATKHLAVLELAKILKIDPQFIAGAGDGYNDFPLLSACGFKAAMANAPDKLKEIADIILPDVAHDGLAVLIGKLLN